tara:strand:+ start:611 stop:910 length:300 start_codon:yes stop_codon:yes gene_type:complete
MMYANSLRYDLHGRKRKSKALNKPKKYKPKFTPLEVGSVHPNHRDQTEYKSAALTPCTQQVNQDDSYKKEISAQYTVSIAFNKGAYQVVPNSDIKHIGK